MPQLFELLTLPLTPQFSLNDLQISSTIYPGKEEENTSIFPLRSSVPSVGKKIGLPVWKMGAVAGTHGPVRAGVH